MAFTVGDLLTPQGAGLAYLAMVFGAGVFYRFARLEWDERERKYLEKHGGDNEPGTD